MRSERVSMPCMMRKALSGAQQPPRSRSIMARSRERKPALPQSLAKTTPW